MRAAFHRAAGELAHRAVTPRFLTPATLASGGLDGVRVLVLPQAIALSDAEAAAIRAFLARGGAVVADGTPGQFDAHGKRRARPALSDVLAADRDPTGRLAELAHGPVRVEGVAAEVRVYDEPDGGMLVALHRDADAAGPAEVTLILPAPAAVTDIRSGAALGRADRLRIALEADAPTILAVRRGDVTAGAPFTPLPTLSPQGEGYLSPLSLREGVGVKGVATTRKFR